MFAFVFMLPEEKRRMKGGARQSRKRVFDVSRRIFTLGE